MISAYSIVEAERAHLGMLAERIRQEDATELEATGWGVRKWIWRSYRGSVIRRSLFVDGEIAAIYGVGGMILSGIGTPWLLTTNAVEKYPISSALVARQEVRAMLEMYPVLRNVVDANYCRAVRLLLLLGFSMSEPFPFGIKRAMFRRFEIRRPPECPL